MLSACNWDWNSCCLVGLIEYDDGVVNHKHIVIVCLASMLTRMEHDSLSLDCLYQQRESLRKMTPVSCVCRRRRHTILVDYADAQNNKWDDHVQQTHHIAESSPRQLLLHPFVVVIQLSAVKFTSLSHRRKENVLKSWISFCLNKLWFCFFDRDCRKKFFFFVFFESFRLRGQVFFVQSRLDLLLSFLQI